MKRLLLPLAMASLLVLSALLPAFAANPVTRNYADLTFSGPYSADVFPDEWNLRACDLLVNYTVDMSAAPLPAGGARTQVEVGLNDGTGFRGGLAAMYFNAAGTDDRMDLNDKLLLVVPGSYSESGYDADGRNGSLETIVSPPLGDSGNTYGFWFDRTGAAAEAGLWGYGNITGSGGVYNVSLRFHSVGRSSTLATQWATVNNAQSVFYTGGWHDGAPDGDDIYPAGRTLTGDLKKVRVQAVMAAGQGGSGSSQIRNIQITGCPISRGHN